MGALVETYVDRKKLFVPGVAKLYEILAPLSHTLIRFSLGVFLIPHGYAKLFQDDAVAVFGGGGRYSVDRCIGREL